jgi:riboflavin kinase/FMN adenylyltransferase
MQIISDIRTAHLSTPTVLTIGNFDGIHLGHQALLREMGAAAGRIAVNDKRPLTAFLTFDPHPLAVLRPHVAVKLLTTPRERLAIAARTGIDVGIIQPFTPEVAALEPGEFMTLLKRHLKLAALVVGPDFALGRNRAGNLDVLRSLGDQLNYQVVTIEPVHLAEQAVRSSAIRQLLEEGDVSSAAAMLGRYYHVTGEVQEGDRRGRQIGVPTANLDTAPDKLWPANGVYATFTWLGGDAGHTPYLSATNIGVRPTVDGLHRRIETHLLDFPPNNGGAGSDGDLYGETLTVEFVARLRGEQRFAGLDALVAQIRADIAATRTLLSAIDTPAPPDYLADSL